MRASEFIALFYIVDHIGDATLFFEAVGDASKINAEKN